VPRVLRDTLVMTRELTLAWGPFILIGLALLALAYWALDPAPPKRVVLATGPERSPYDEFGKRYKAELARYGIEVVLKPTHGASCAMRSGKSTSPSSRADRATPTVPPTRSRTARSSSPLAACSTSPCGCSTARRPRSTRSRT
jgi:hypothetical protein